MKFQEYRILPALKANIEELGFIRPTDIQFKAIPNILQGEDVLAIAQTGTGKTAAFVIPIVHILETSRSRKDGVRCLVLAPTYELVQQIDKVFYQFSKNTDVKCACIHGGVDQAPQIKKLVKGVDVVVATPGRVFDLINQGYLHIDHLKILVLDEADHMLDLGFYKDIEDLQKHIPKNRQTLFFSATINEKIKKLAYSLVKNAIRIQISPKDPVSKNVEHSVAHIEMDDKRFFLESFVKNNPESKILVFVRTKVRAERVKKAMERVEIVTDSIHSDRTADERKMVMQNFRTGELRILIATDVSARGIDIPNVDFVINYDLPESLEHYVHRIGRTGRGTLKGQAFSFCSAEEMPILKMIEEGLPKPIQKFDIDKIEYEFIKDSSEDNQYDWRKLLAEDALEDKKPKKKKKK